MPGYEHGNASADDVEPGLVLLQRRPEVLQLDIMSTHPHLHLQTRGCRLQRRRCDGFTVGFGFRNGELLGVLQAWRVAVYIGQLSCSWAASAGSWTSTIINLSLGSCLPTVKKNKVLCDLGVVFTLILRWCLFDLLLL